MGDRNDETIDGQKKRITSCNVQLEELIYLRDGLDSQIKTLTSILTSSASDRIEIELNHVRADLGKKQQKYYEERLEDYFKAFYEEQLKEAHDEIEAMKRRYEEQKFRVAMLQLQLNYERECRADLRNNEIEIERIVFKKDLALARNQDVLIKYHDNLKLLHLLVLRWKKLYNDACDETWRFSLEDEIKRKYETKISHLEAELKLLKARLGDNNLDDLDGPIAKYEGLVKKIPTDVRTRHFADGTYVFFTEAKRDEDNLQVIEEIKDWFKEVKGDFYEFWGAPTAESHSVGQPHRKAIAASGEHGPPGSRKSAGYYGPQPPQTPPHTPTSPQSPHHTQTPPPNQAPPPSPHHKGRTKREREGERERVTAIQ